MNVEEKEDEYFINKRAIGELFDSKFDLNTWHWGQVLYLTLASCRFSLPQTQLHRTTLWPGRYA